MKYINAKNSFFLIYIRHCFIETMFLEPNHSEAYTGRLILGMWLERRKIMRSCQKAECASTRLISP